MLAAVVALFVEWERPDATVRLDEGIRDGIVRSTANLTPETRIAVVDIDEDSLGELGPWPWPRGVVADLVELLIGTYGAKAVGLDIVFPEPGDAEGDRRLAALAIHAPVTLAQVFDYTPRDPALLLGVAGAGKAVAPTARAVPGHGYIANHSELAGAPCIGNVGFIPDADGVLRRTPVLTRFRDKDYLHFAVALLGCSGGRLAPRVVPEGDAHGLWRIPFRRALSAYTVIPAADVLRERISPALLTGRYVLVGSSSLGLGDRVSTPLAPLTTGVMAHAASLSALLDEAEGHQPLGPRLGAVPLAWTAASLLLALVGLARFSAWGNLLLLLGLAAGWSALAAWGVGEQAEWSFSTPLCAYLLLLLTAVPYEWWRAQRNTRRLISTFSHYVARPVLDEILRLDLVHSLEPTLRQVTVLIADMEGYTRTTSSLSLEDGAALTKSFLDCLTRPVLAWGGTLDKYSGDGLVAFWGAPLICADQSDRAVSAALEIIAAVDELNRSRTARGFERVRVRIGIESGQALVGDLGTPFRSTYTAVGDCINFASRLEGAARDLPTDLVIGAAANARLLRHPTRSLGTVALRGTHTVIDVFTTLDDGHGTEEGIASSAGGSQQA